MRKVLLIWPKGYEIGHVIPISLGYLKANTPDRYEVKILDCSFEKIPADSERLKKEIQDFNPDVLGVSLWTHVYQEAMTIFDVARKIKPELVTLAGGTHCTSYYDRMLREQKNIDFIFRGESERSFVDFLDELYRNHLKKDQCDWSKIKSIAYRLEDGSIKSNPMDQFDDLDEVKIPDYDAMQLHGYVDAGYRFHTNIKMNAPMWVTRGCPYRCTFCTAPVKDGRRIRKHSIPYLLRWIKYLYHEKGIRNIGIIDDNFTFDMKFAKEFCRSVIDLKLKGLHFTTPNGVRIQRTDIELLGLMKKAGWRWIVMAPESGSPKTLKRMKKDTGTEIFYTKVREARSVGLKVMAFFIIGYPGETPEDLKLTSKMIRKCKFDFFYLNNFQPLPGTPIYDELLASKEINHGIMPRNYVSGERVYVPEGLRDFNFSRYMMKEYLIQAIRHPSGIIFTFQVNNIFLALKKLFENLANMFKKPENTVLAPNSIRADA